MVISIYGGSGSGKTTLATALQQYFFNDGRGCYLLSDDDYPHRIPKRNDEEQLRVYKEAGEDGLRGYLGTKKEIDFARINEVLAAFGTERWRDFIGRNRFFRNICIASGVDARRQ